jgi:hypothetical protein
VRTRASSGPEQRLRDEIGLAPPPVPPLPASLSTTVFPSPPPSSTQVVAQRGQGDRALAAGASVAAHAGVPPPGVVPVVHVLHNAEHRVLPQEMSLVVTGAVDIANIID